MSAAIKARASKHTPAKSSKVSAQSATPSAEDAGRTAPTTLLQTPAQPLPRAGAKLVEAIGLPTRLHPGKAPDKQECWEAFASSLKVLGAPVPHADTSQVPLHLVDSGPPGNLTVEVAAELHRLMQALPDTFKVQDLRRHVLSGPYLAMYRVFAIWLAAAGGAVIGVQSAEHLRNEVTKYYHFPGLAWCFFWSLSWCVVIGDNLLDRHSTGCA